MVRVTAVALAALAARPIAAQGPAQDGGEGQRLYHAACANCHGDDGRGAPVSRVAFETPLPDFSRCTFTTREANQDWAATVAGGGPMRGFSRMMPAFGDALSPEQIERVLDYVRTFCTNPRWPRGELNLPRALVTEKAYPEDEAVLTTEVNVQGAGAVTNTFVYERRFGGRSQVEVAVPFGWREGTGTPDGGGAWGIGDVALGFKQVLAHSLRRGLILSVTGEVTLPTGSEQDGLGGGTAILEPFVTLGKILPGDAFAHAQAGFEFPTASGHADEAFWRLTLGRTFAQQDGAGRTWSPMVELLGASELAAGEPASWDLLPQLQVSLSARQHILANVGVRIPLSDPGTRDTQLLFYILWDWFDGGLFDGW